MRSCVASARRSRVLASFKTFACSSVLQDASADFQNARPGRYLLKTGPLPNRLIACPTGQSKSKYTSTTRRDARRAGASSLVS